MKYYKLLFVNLQKQYIKTLESTIKKNDHTIYNFLLRLLTTSNTMSILQNEETELSRPCELKQKIKTKLWTELTYVDVISHFSIKNQNKRNTRNTVEATQKSLKAQDSNELSETKRKMKQDECKSWWTIMVFGFINIYYTGHCSTSSLSHIFLSINR